MQNTDAQAAADFLGRVFGPATSGPVYVSSLPNDRNVAGEPGERNVATRDPQAIRQFIERWDRAGRGLFFCVSAVAPGSTRRAKETVVELPFLHADIDLKDISISLDEVRRRVEALPNPPSIVVSSGHGLHLYWMLKEAIIVSDVAEVTRAEACLRLLSDLVGGDTSVAEVARLMRLPGTNNTKDGNALPVALLRADYDAFHLIEDIEEMLSYLSPVVQRRTVRATSDVASTNPYLAAAARMGFKAPIDVQRRLEAMSYQGAGDACIHQTQVSVSAALLSRGTDVAQTISLVLDATRAAAGAYGENWNWVREERAVRRMCDDWVKKNPPAAQAPSVQPRVNTMGATSSAAVVKLADHRPPPRAKSPAKEKATPPHVVLAAAMIEGSAVEGHPFLSVAEASGDRQLWRYSDGLWAMVASIDVEIEVAARVLGIPTSMKLRSETMAAIKADPAVVKTKTSMLWDGHGLIPARNGLVDIETLQLQAYRPEHHATWRLPFDFDSDAACPCWERAVSAFFRDKDEDQVPIFVSLIQEVAGAGFLATKSRALSRALVLFGPHNAGKSQILNVLTGLYGRTPIAQPLTSLEGEHGTVPFTRHAPWVLHEAFNQGKWVLSDKIKQLITGEPIQINIKRGLQFEHIYRAPILWATNHAPQVKDASRAVASRMLVVPCNGAFDDQAPIGVAAEAVAAGFASVSDFILEHEGPGVLRWAVEGLRRVLARKHFETPVEMATVQQDIYDDSNPVAEFIRDCCSFTPARMVRVTDFMAAYAVWFGEQRGENLTVPSTITVGRAVTSLGDARIGTDKMVFRRTADRFYGGLVLNTVGLDYWHEADGQSAARGRIARRAKTVADVNQDIPGSWDEKREVVRMRKAHGPPDRAGPNESNDVRKDDRCNDRCMTDGVSSVIKSAKIMADQRFISEEPEF